MDEILITLVKQLFEFQGEVDSEYSKSGRALYFYNCKVIKDFGSFAIGNQFDCIILSADHVQFIRNYEIVHVGKLSLNLELYTKV